MDLRRSVCVSKKRLHRFFEKGSGAARKALSAFGKIPAEGFGDKFGPPGAQELQGGRMCVSLTKKMHPVMLAAQRFPACKA